MTQQFARSFEKDHTDGSEIGPSSRLAALTFVGAPHG